MPLPTYPPAQYGQYGYPATPSVPLDTSGYGYAAPPTYPPQQTFPPQMYGQPSMPLPLAPPSQPLQAPGSSATQLSLANFMKLFGTSPDPVTVLPTNAIQRRFKESLPQYATNPIAGAAIGGIVATVACILLTFVLTLIVGAIAGPALRTSASGSSGSITSDPFVGQFFNEGLLNLVAIEHHASLVVSASVTIVSASVTITPPLTLLLLLPALSLVLGGYISASTDYSNQLRYVLTRAAAVGPLYGIILTLVVAVFGTQSLNEQGVTATITTSWTSLLLNSIAIGTVFASIGGLIKLFGRRWRAGTVAYLLSKPHGMIVSSITGALAAVGTGLVLTLPLLALVFGVTDMQLRLGYAMTGADPSSYSSSVNLLLLAVVILSLPLTIAILAFSSGATLNASALGSSILQSTTGSQGTLSILHLPSEARYALVLFLIPAIAYFIGGRAAVRVMGTSATPQNRWQAGALVGVWSSVLMLILGSLSSISLSGSAAGGGGSAAAGLDFGSTFLGTLVVGAVFGVAGTSVSFGSRRQRGPGFWLRAGAVLSLILGIGVPAASYAFILLSGNFPLANFEKAYPFIGGAMLMLPCMCFAAALITALGHLPPGSEGLANAVSPSSVGVSSPASMPLPVSVAATYRPMAMPSDAPTLPPPPIMPPSTLPPMQPPTFPPMPQP